MGLMGMRWWLEGAPPFLLFVLCLLLLGGIIYWQIKTLQAVSDPLEQELIQAIDIDAPEAVFQEAIQLAAKNLAEELGIDLKNYDLTKEQYEALVLAAAEKFGFCEQYRLLVQISGNFPCYSCTSRPMILLQTSQTFKIGQTCLEEKGRYSGQLPVPGLIYQEEFRGSIFEVLVAEHVKLLLFRYGIERKSIIKANLLTETALLLPAGNKILR